MKIRPLWLIAAALLSVSACSSTPTPQLAFADDEVVHGAVPGSPGSLDSDNQPKFLRSGMNSIGNPAIAPATIYQ